MFRGIYRILNSSLNIFKMAKIERYEAKLNTMAYIGLFDELVRGLIPVCILVYLLICMFVYIFWVFSNIKAMNEK